MREYGPTTKSMRISDVKRRLSTLVNEVCGGETRVLVEKSGIPVAAMVSPADLQRLTQMDEEDREAWAVVNAMRAAFQDVPQEEIEREAARSVAEVRAEMRAERQAAAKSA